MSPTMPIELDRASAEPLYRQVATNLRRAIDDRRLRPGHRVPSVRALAAQLDVSRLTVATAYDQLVAEGYLVGRIGFGTVVAGGPRSRTGGRCRSGPDRPVRRSTRPPAEPADGVVPRLGTGRSSRPLPGGTPRFDLRSSAAAGWSGTTDRGLAVGANLERLLREEFRRVAERGGGGEIPDPAGDARLRDVIAGHLRATRAARCDPAQVVVLSGAVLGATIIGRLWVGNGRRVAVEDPGDPLIRRALLADGGEAVGIAVDGQGWRADLLPAGVQVALVAPTVQVPTGSMLPLARRLRTLAWASANGALVVEDGRFDDHLLRAARAALSAGPRHRRPGHPPGLVREPPARRDPDGVRGRSDGPRRALRRGARDDRSGRVAVQQRALGRFLADGLMDRHLGRVRRCLVDRQDAMLGRDPARSRLARVRPTGERRHPADRVHRGPGLVGERGRRGRGRGRRRPRIAGCRACRLGARPGRW